MYKYQVNIFWCENDQCYIAEVPELPGCMADGETQKEALDNSQIIIKEWLETAKDIGREIPVPQGYLKHA